MQTLTSLPHTIPSPDSAAMLCAQQHIDGPLKPPGSLGRFESLAIQLAGVPGLKGVPHANSKTILVMCADHGVWDEGVVASPKVVAAIQATNTTCGTTSACVLTAQTGTKTHVIDVGTDTESIPGVVNMRVTRGCGNIAEGPATSRSRAEELLLEIIRYTHELVKDGVTLFSVGELGMANTTPTAAIVSVLADSDAEEVVGTGANLSLSQAGNKVDAVRRAIAVNQLDRFDGVNVLAKVGGFDLVGIAGVMLGAASCSLPVVLDSLPSYSIALAVSQITPQIKPYLVLSHFSAGKGARTTLTHLESDPYLNMGMRLGESSGVALATPIIEAACTMYKNIGQLAVSNIVLLDGKETQLPLNLNLT